MWSRNLVIRGGHSPRWAAEPETQKITAQHVQAHCISLKAAMLEYHTHFSYCLSDRKYSVQVKYWGHVVAQLLRHCATNQKLVGSIPNGVIGIFPFHNPSGRNRALEYTQPLTEMSTRNIPGGKGGRYVRLTTLPHPCDDCLKIWIASTSWNPQGLPRPVMGLLYLYRVKYFYQFSEIYSS
jgi:hypothetical protein